MFYDLDKVPPFIRDKFQEDFEKETPESLKEYLDLFKHKMISRETVLERFGLSYEEELDRLRAEHPPVKVKKNWFVKFLEHLHGLLKERLRWLFESRT